MNKKTTKLSRQQRRKNRDVAENKRLKRLKEQHFTKQLEFIKHAQYEITKSPHARQSLPRKSISMRVPSPLLNDLDYLALEKGVTRSELIIFAIDHYLQNQIYLQTGNYSEALHDV